MSPDLHYGLLLVAALAHATWNALIHRAADRLLMMAAIRLVGLLFGFAVLPFVPWPSHAAWILLHGFGSRWHLPQPSLITACSSNPIE